MTEDRNLYLSQLTSLRGVACLAVLIGHAIQVFHYHRAPESYGGWLVQSLITNIFNAEAAVLLFFVLSGCVLSLSLRSLTGLDAKPLASFYVKRVFRIFPLLWLAVGLAVLSMVVARPLVADGIFVDWLARNLTTPLTLPHTVLSLTGMYTRYNGPMWSLRVELIYSLLFPAIFLLVRSSRTRLALLVGLLVIALLPLPSILGISFGLSFAMGALIPTLSKPTGRFHALGAILALAVLLYDRFILMNLHPPERVFDVIETLAAFVVVRDVYGSGRSYRLLVWRPMVWLGELSYSVYLLHLPFMLIVFTGLAHVFGLASLIDRPNETQIILVVITAVLTVSVSALTYNFLELPMHNLGRRLSRQIEGGSLKVWSQAASSARRL